MVNMSGANSTASSPAPRSRWTSRPRAAEKRRQALLEKRDREHKEMWAERHAREAEAAEKAARLLVTGLGAAGTIELFTMMNRVSFDLVQQLLGHRSTLGDYSFLPEGAIEAKFGAAS
jgi:hypothetical protein